MPTSTARMYGLELRHPTLYAPCLPHLQLPARMPVQHEPLPGTCDLHGMYRYTSPILKPRSYVRSYGDTHI